MLSALIQRTSILPLYSKAIATISVIGACCFLQLSLRATGQIKTSRGTPVGRHFRIGSSLDSGTHEVRNVYQGEKGPPLEVFNAGSPSLDYEISKYFPGIAGREGYQQARPYMVLIHNPTEKTVRAYEFVWRVKSRQGDVLNVQNHIRFVVTTPLDMSWPGGDQSRDHAIRPGEAKLLLPNYEGDASNLSDFSETTKNLISPDSTLDSVRVHLDCAVYGDGTFTGPNRLRLLRRYLVTRNAQHDEALTVWSQLKKNPQDPTIANYLMLRRRIGSAYRRSDNAAAPIYIHARAVAASEFELVLDRGGPKSLINMTESLVRVMPPFGRRSVLGATYRRSKFLVDGTSNFPEPPGPLFRSSGGMQ